MQPFKSSSKMNHAATDVLVIHCSDHRFQAGLYEFLNSGLKLGAKYDLLVIPGGPQCLTLADYLPKFSWASREWFRFLLEAHAPKRIILIAHQDCGWYKSLPAFLHSGSEPRQRQEEDLRRAREALTRDFPGLNVELYYAGWDSTDRMTLETVSP